MIHYLAAVTMTMSALAATPQPLQWQADYGKALAATRSDDRPLVVVLDVPSDPKASMEKKLASDDKAQADLLNSYQRCHIDVTTEYGKKVAKVFGATKFPFTAIIDKTGSVILSKKLGQLTESEWKETLATYQKGERVSPVSMHTTFFRGDDLGTPIITNRPDCPSCQLRPQGM